MVGKGAGERGGGGDSARGVPGAAASTSAVRDQPLPPNTIQTVCLEQGEALLHLGELKHRGVDITSGVRYILVVGRRCGPGRVGYQGGGEKGGTLLTMHSAHATPRHTVLSLRREDQA